MAFTKGHPFYAGGEKGWIKQGSKLSDETRKRMSETRKKLGIKPPSARGRIVAEATKEKLRQAHLGKKRRPLTEEAKQHLSEIHKGAKSHLWKGGITKVNRGIRVSPEYRKWRRQVLIKDNHICVVCGSKNRLEVDHIKAFADYPKLRLDVNNGRVLCNQCHTKTDNYGWNRHNKRGLSICQ